MLVQCPVLQATLAKPACLSLHGLVISSYSINSGMDIQSVFIKEGSIFVSRAHEENRKEGGETRWRRNRRRDAVAKDDSVMPDVRRTV
jgi:hypothetical protein